MAHADLAERARRHLVLDDTLSVHEAEHDGMTTVWWAAGAANGARPLVLVHGGGAGADAIGNWFGVLPRLAERRRVYAVDLLGFGRSRHVGEAPYDQSQRVRHLAGWCRELGIGSADWVGNSMGGATVLQLALDHPALAASIVLMGSAGLPIPVSPELHEILAYDTPDPEAMGRIVAGLTHRGYRPPPGMVQYRYELTDDRGRMARYVATMELVREGDMVLDADRLAEIEVPVQLLCGRDDRVVPFEAAIEFHHRLPDARLYSIPGCGHWPMLEHPEEFLAVAELFLARSGRPAAQPTGEHR